MPGPRTRTPLSSALRLLRRLLRLPVPAGRLQCQDLPQVAFGQFQPPALPGLFLFFLHHLSHVLGRPERLELQEPTPPSSSSSPQLPSAPRGAFLPLEGVWGSVLVETHSLQQVPPSFSPSSGPRWPLGRLPLPPSCNSEVSSAMTDKTWSRASCLPCPSAQRLHHRNHFQHLPASFDV